MKKNVLKRGICLLLTIMLLLGNIPAVFAAEDSGECGEGVTWKLADGVLTISGEGEMEDYDANGQTAPWHEAASTITKIVIEKGVTYIGEGAFVSCNATSISIGETVNSIGYRSFAECDELTTLVLPNSLETIGSHAFYGSAKLAKIEIPASVKTIESRAFMTCVSLDDVILPNSLEAISNGLFSNCLALKTITIPNSIKAIGEASFNACTTLKSLTLPNSIETIGKLAFQDCHELEELVIPASVTSIGEDIFASSPKVADVYFGGTKAAWEELKCEVPEGGFVHYNTTTVAGHWETKTVESTCEALGYTAEVCECEYVRNKVDAEGEKPDHTWADATCTAPKTCSVCGATEGEPVHTYNQEVVDEKYLKSPATAETKAVYYKSCVCGAKGEETFEVDTHTEHVYDKEVAVDQYLKSAATCTAKAVYYKSCACGEKGEETFEAGELAAHVCDKEVVDEKYLKSAATCKAKAVYFKSCECGEKGEETFETGELAKHVCDKEVVDEKYLKSAATCTAKAVYFKSCECGEKGEETFEAGELAKHVCDKEVVDEKYLKSAATCTAKAVYFKSCECGEKGEETFETGEFADHVFDQEVVDEKYLKSAATDETNAVYYKSCVCGEKGEETFEVEAHTEHVYDKEVAVDQYLKSAATCTAKAVYYKSCACGEKGEETFEAGELAEHVCDKEVATEDYLKSAATCTAKAVYFKSCECGEKGEETFETGEFADHVFDKEVVDEKYLKSAATAETNAVYYKSCVCGEKGEETFEVEAHTEHVYDKEVVAEKYLKSAATCTAKAVYFKSCECGAKGEETFETGELAAHDLGQWTTTKEATCTEAGSKSRKCSRCDFAETETIAKTEHQYTSAVTAPTCTAGGYTTHTCAKCGHSYTDTAVAKLGHAMGQWVKVKEATPVAEGQEKRTCSRCGTVENRTTTYQGNALVLKDADLLKQDTVWINGMPYPVKGSGNNKYVELPSAAECLLVTYTYHVGDAKDVHTQYPTGMKVYRVTKGASGFQAAHIPALDNLLQYSGSSIRITGKKGIRMITSLTKSNKAALTGAGLAGYKLLEYGTMLCWSSEIKAGDALVLGKSFTRSNFAYKRGVADPVFATSGNLTQYTNVLVGFNNDQCKDDIAMRPYIILEDAAGKQVTLYGGTIHRSIGYIAYQNRNVFKSGTESYKYVWSIIHHVYGKKYDADYKG